MLEHLTHQPQGVLLVYSKVNDGRLSDLIADLDHRIKRVHGSLRNQGDGRPANILAEFLVAQQHNIRAIQVYAP